MKMYDKCEECFHYQACLAVDAEGRVDTDSTPINCEYFIPNELVKIDLTNDDWEKAENHLNATIVGYVSIGAVGQIALQGVLMPLVNRFNSGERTYELYKKMMSVE